MTAIVTIRHAVTAHNAAQVISGRLDEPLSERGRANCREMRNLGVVPNAELVIASPMRRAIETAEILTGRARAEIKIDARCVERDYGALQGLDSRQVRAFDDRVHYIEVGGVFHSLDPPGGEALEAVRSRAELVAATLMADLSGTVLVVSHQVFLQQLHGVLLGSDVHAALAFDIRSLQIDLFTPASHSVLHPGMGNDRSW